MGKCKRKMADGGMVAAGQKQWQERLAEMWATKPKPAAYADGGAVETPEQVMARMAKKYGTGVPEQKAETPPQRPPTGQPQQNPQQPTSRAASLVDSVNRRNDELKKAANYAVGGMVGEGSTIQQSLGMIGGPRYDVGGDNAPVWDDGTRRDGLTPEQAQQLKSEKAMADARASAGIGAQAAPVVAPQPAPLMTMAERQVAQGINPNAAYRPGGPGDPHASGGMAATAAQTASLAAAQPALPVPPIAQPIVNPMDATQRRGQRRTAAYADGGRVIPVNIGQGLYQAIAQPIAEDWRQGNVAIKNLRDQYPTADAIAGIHPAVAAAQVANDVMSGQVGGDTAMNVAQAVPMVKGLSGMAKMLSKQSGPTVGGVKFVVDMPTTLKKNAVITAGQTLGQPANAFADGGMVKFSGKGGPRDDQIPVKVAGAEIRVSDGEQAVILPAKTANNPGAVQAIGQIIQQSNDGRAPKMGMADGGRYEFGSLPVRQVADEIDLIRGRLETANAQAADKASMNAYKAELATRDVMAARAAEGQNMQAALDSAKSQPAINPKALPAQPIYRPNWTAGNNAPVLEGVVETADELRAKAAQPAARAIAAPQPGTAVTPRTVDWTPGGGAPAGGPVQARTVDWTYGQGGGPTQQPGMARSATPAAAPLSITGPQEAIKADPRTMARTAAAARASGGMSPEAAAFDASRTQTTAPSAEAAKQPSKLSGMAGKAAKILAPVAKFATVADIAANAYNSGRDGGAIQLAPSEQQTDDYVNQGGMAQFASAAKHGLLSGALNVGDAAAGVIDGAAGLPNLILPKNAQIPSVQQTYRQKAQDAFTASGDNGTVTIRADQQKSAPQQSQASYSNEGRQSVVQAANIDAQTADPRIAATTGNSGARVMPSGAVEVNMGRGFDPTKLAMAPGSGMVSDATGRTMVVTNMDPNQYTAADGTKNARWEQTQAYIDAQNRLQADKLRLAEMQAVRQGMNPVQAAAATQGMAQAAQKAPLDRQVVQQQIETGKVAAENNKALQGLAAEMQQTDDPAKLAALETRYRVLTGKSKEAPPEQLDNIVVKEYSPDGSGMVTGERIETRSKTGRAGSASPAPTKVITKEMQAKLAPALAAQGLTLEKYAAMHGLTVSK